jgi:hypothetical protein
MFVVKIKIDRYTLSQSQIVKTKVADDFKLTKEWLKEQLLKAEPDADEDGIDMWMADGNWSFTESVITYDGEEEGLMWMVI